MKGFVISWFYPPINSSEGLVTFKLLNQSGIQHDVFTQKDNDLWSYNTSEKSLTNPSIGTIFGDSSSLERWVTSCIDYFDKHHKEYDFIMSRSMPPESHIAAMAIKQKYPHIKWVASFGDPIYNSPYSKIAMPVFDPGPKTARFLTPKYFAQSAKKSLKKQLWNYQTRGDRKDENERQNLERTALESADVIIFNNSYQQDFMLEQHQLTAPPKFIVLPHSFESALYPKIRKENHKRLTISHIGHLDKIRTPVNMLRALKRLKSQRPNLYSQLDLRFYGTLDDPSKIFIINNGLSDTVSIHEPVDYTESLSIMQQSDWCLLVDANIAKQVDKNIYFAAKLADYLGSKSPILAVSMIEGASADIIRNTGNILSSHSVDEIYMTLVMILENKLTPHASTTTRKPYSASNVAKGYDEMIDNLVKSTRSK